MPEHSRRIVVGVDRSLGARVALEEAARRAGPDGSLVVAHVMTALSEAILRAVTDLDEERHTGGRELLERLASDAGVTAETRLLDGPPAERLTELAREVDADELVVGSRGIGRVAAALGSVSHALLAHADRPVVVVPQAAADHPRHARPGDPATVVVGYDGSPPARAALAYAARRAAGGGRVIAVHAFQPASDWLGSPYYDRALAAYQAEGRELLRALEEEQADSDVVTSLLEGPPAKAIVAAAAARDADEIVIGSRGFGRVRGVLGSVSHAVLHEADRPVVVIAADAVG